MKDFEEIRKLRQSIDKNVIHLNNQSKVINDNSGMKIHTYETYKGHNEVGFFPYRLGLSSKINNRFPINGIMILGQDFGNMEYLSKLDSRSEENYSRTWDKMTALLKQIEKELRKSITNKTFNLLELCFFTNAILGVRKFGKMSGFAPPLKDGNKDKEKDFLNWCYNWFELQIETQKPKIIICMGKAVYQFLKLYSEEHCGLFNNLKQQLQGFSSELSYKKLENLRQISVTTKYKDKNETKTNFLLIVHPSAPNRKNIPTEQEDIDLIKKNYKVMGK